MRRRLLYALAALLTTIAGAATRFAHLGLPKFLVKYGGSALWAAAIFWMISVLLPRFKPSHRACLALAISAAIEFFKLAESPAIDHLRETLPGKLVLGRYFAWADLAAYSIGVALVLMLDPLIAAHRFTRSR